MYALGSIVDRDRLEFLVQRELLNECGAQLGVVIHNQYLAAIGHALAPGQGEVDHSTGKEQADCEGRKI